MGAVSEQPDNEHGVQAGTPTQDFLAYTTKKKKRKLSEPSACTIKNETLVCTTEKKSMLSNLKIQTSGVSISLRV